jgi:hypothetical protein
VARPYCFERAMNRMHVLHNGVSAVLSEHEHLRLMWNLKRSDATVWKKLISFLLSCQEYVVIKKRLNEALI